VTKGPTGGRGGHATKKKGQLLRIRRTSHLRQGIGLIEYAERLQARSKAIHRITTCQKHQSWFHGGRGNLESVGKKDGESWEHGSPTVIIMPMSDILTRDTN